MKKRIMLSMVVTLSLLITACRQSGLPDVEPVPTEDTITAVDADKDLEGIEPSVASEFLGYPWMAPEVDPLGYEEFFAEERVYQDTEAPGYGFTRTAGAFWSIGDGNSYTAYVLELDESGFYICKFSDKKNPLYRIPDTAELVDCQKVITNTRQLYCIRGGELLCVDVVSGQTTVLHTAEKILDMVLCYNDVLYFLTKSDDALSLVRSYLPTMTTELLYEQPAPNVPETWYRLLMPTTNQSSIIWETMNPAFWAAVQEIFNDPDRLDIELAYPSAFDFAYITEHSSDDEAVQHNFSQLQNELDLRPRMRGCYDISTDTYTETYGIYDICFFGTGIHSDDEHFASYQEY